MTVERQLRISNAGLRGIVGHGLNADHVLDFAAAFGTFLDAGPVIIGRDPRSSGVMMRQGVIAALLSTGHDVTDLDVASSPVIQHAIQRTGAVGGISIGASHNSAEWNALKFFGPKGTYLSTSESGELLDIYHLKKFRYVAHDALGKLREDKAALDHYLDELAGYFDLPSLAGMRIVADCCNGTSALILRRMRERFGLDIVLINERLEGASFAHEPAINRKAVALQLAPLIRPLNAVAGFLFDMDSDRVAVAAEDGSPVSEELVLPMIAGYLLPRGPGKLVITNLSTSALIEEVAAEHGGKVIRVPVGRQAAMDALAAYNAGDIALAGEGTGAIMMPRFRFVYDGIASMLAILSRMRESGEPLSTIVENFPRYFIRKGEAPLVSQRVPALMMELQKQYRGESEDLRDGLRVTWPDRWFHVRVSETEPIMRVICERKGQSPDELFESLMNRIGGLS